MFTPFLRKTEAIGLAGPITLREEPMDGIKLVLFAVLCSADSLSCIEVPTSEHVFATPDQCEQQLQRSLLSLRTRHPFYVNPMGRCRYLLMEQQAHRVAEWREPPKKIEEAFGLVDQAEREQNLLNRLRIAAKSSDRLAISGCDGDWLGLPNCTADEDHIAAQQPATVTVENPAGENASVLVRLPVGQLATRR